MLIRPRFAVAAGLMESEYGKDSVGQCGARTRRHQEMDRARLWRQSNALEADRRFPPWKPILPADPGQHLARRQRNDVTPAIGNRAAGDPKGVSTARPPQECGAANEDRRPTSKRKYLDG